VNTSNAVFEDQGHAGKAEDLETLPAMNTPVRTVRHAVFIRPHNPLEALAMYWSTSMKSAGYPILG
jgi:hypothetical protein